MEMTLFGRLPVPVAKWSLDRVGVRIRTGSGIINFRYRFCDGHFLISFIHWRVVFHPNSHGTASLSLEAVSVPSTDVIAAKTFGELAASNLAKNNNDVLYELFMLFLSVALFFPPAGKF